MTDRRVVGFGSITDVPGIEVGHAHRRSRGWRTGTTVVLAARGAVAGVDVRGGGPGTRETDALRPGTLVEQIHAISLSGGSAYGLAAADGVMHWLEARRAGVRVGDADHEVVPVVPAAVIFDLGRGGRFRSRPDAEFGRRACDAARRTAPARGAVGAGTGAIAGGLQGGVGTASATVGSIRVGAIIVLNAAGSVIDPASGLPWYCAGLGLTRPDAAARRALAEATRRPPPTLNTTIGVIATSARLLVPEVTKMAAVGHDGIARAVRPAHSMFDGDTLFGLATGEHELLADPPAIDSTTEAEFRREPSRPGMLNAVLDAAADCVARACTDAVLAASAHRGSPAGPPAYRDLAPAVVPETW